MKHRPPLFRQKSYSLLLLGLIFSILSLNAANELTTNENIEQKKLVREAYKKDSDLLWKVLKENSLSTMTDKKATIDAATLIVQLVKKNPKILENRRNNITPEKFALEQCPFLISKAFEPNVDLTKYYDAVTYELKSPYSDWAKKFAEKLATTTTKILLEYQASLEKTSYPKKVVNNEIEGKTFGITFEFQDPGNNNADLVITITTDESSKELGYVGFKWMNKDKTVELELHSLKIDPSSRQQGLGGALVLTVITVMQQLIQKLPRELYKKRVISLVAQPPVEKRQTDQTRLDNFYKWLGFMPSDEGSHHFAMFFDAKGSLVTET